MSLPLYHVDAFASRPFAGNPAAVCILDKPQPDEWLAQVAAEMNLSETAFLLAESDAYRLRWFTPTVEVALCGHATLASAHVLWTEGYCDPSKPVTFHTQSGALIASRRDGEIELDFPLTRETACDSPAGLAEALGAAPSYVGRSAFDFLVELDSAEAVRALKPDFHALAAIPVRGVIVTSRSDDEHYDFISRFFAPAAGIDEDPVTGSAHCCLADFWGRRFGKDSMTGYQGSARSGIVRVRLAGDRVLLGGHAITISRGELLAP